MTCQPPPPPPPFGPPGLLLRRGQSDNGPSSRPPLSNRKNAVATAMTLFVPAPQGHSPPTRTVLSPWASVSLRTSHGSPPAVAQPREVVQPSEATAAQATVLGSGTPQHQPLPPSWPCPLASPQAQAPAHRCAPHTKGSDSLKPLARPSPSATCFLSGKMAGCRCGGMLGQGPAGGTGASGDPKAEHLAEVMLQGG